MENKLSEFQEQSLTQLNKDIESYIREINIALYRNTFDTKRIVRYNLNNINDVTEKMLSVLRKRS